MLCAASLRVPACTLTQQNWAQTWQKLLEPLNTVGTTSGLFELSHLLFKETVKISSEVLSLHRIRYIIYSFSEYTEI